ncbi:MAG TPA: CehA/McbA family metallohydrolase [Kofleriaceae bacterium]|nr:CehA/McbA family metallohydrolase [Kofleriaceae bacterium]
MKRRGTVPVTACHGVGPLLLVALGACAPQEAAPVQPVIAQAPPLDAPLDAPSDAPVPPEDATLIAPTTAEVWLKGSTHVHARPSGDSTTPIPEVLRWYEARGYDFIVLTDHNKVSEVDATSTTAGSPAVRAPETGLIVLAGIELTHNPSGCTPPGDPSGKCRIHVNLLGVTGRPVGKVEWADRTTNERARKYDAALAQQRQLGGIAQLNHPSWFWGMNHELLAELAGRGYGLVEIANSAFSAWNAGDSDHPSMDAIWDGALALGARIWGVASDDAHDYGAPGTGKYPAGGGWIVVKARRDPASILAAITGGRFYASTGVVLARAEVDGQDLVVEVAPSERGSFTIEMIENATSVGKTAARSARRPVPATGYLRAVVTRGDGAKAWVQPARR